MATDADVWNWFEQTSGFPWSDWEDPDEELADLSIFVREDLLDWARLMREDVLRGAAGTRGDLNVQLTAALFFYLGHVTAKKEGTLVDLETLLSDEQVDATCREPGLSESPNLEEFIRVIAHLATNFNSPL